eukprot:COSAG01_NODE_11182_length_1988_cov_10.358920_1_plen_200_part_00
MFRCTGGDGGDSGGGGGGGSGGSCSGGGGRRRRGWQVAGGRGEVTSREREKMSLPVCWGLLLIVKCRYANPRVFYCTVLFLANRSQPDTLTHCSSTVTSKICKTRKTRTVKTRPWVRACVLTPPSRATGRLGPVSRHAGAGQDEFRGRVGGGARGRVREPHSSRETHEADQPWGALYRDRRAARPHANGRAGARSSYAS